MQKIFLINIRFFIYFYMLFLNSSSCLQFYRKWFMVSLLPHFFDNAGVYDAPMQVSLDNRRE